jgi:hypothetical protein
MPPPPTTPPPKRGWWIAPLIILVLFITGVVVAWQSNEIARELLAKSFMTLAGWLATPFILETSAAITGVIIVLTYNEWRRSKEGPEWVEMEVPDKPDASRSTAEKQGEAQD